MVIKRPDAPRVDMAGSEDIARNICRFVSGVGLEERKLALKSGCPLHANEALKVAP